ncbi:hypothetical protein A5893_15675 [Pedobacter psychrophilus]|uniref:LVIVD repeat-containing protein n=1 Tax=Pedobacter psychrophilus TaxID=1826909 RepID=A0A179DB08_9SPHI|nr:hypothetical protein [Pedobacter psychrophilus]OAQ38235.1 hypothetical protein A5893_15675 [Pedobacter psychrophilus]
MKKSIFFIIAVLFISACTPIGSNTPVSYTDYVPVLLSRSSLSTSVRLKPTTNIGDAAKIYYKDNFIFISERFKGVHIIDNSNPKLPVNKGYIAVPGCVDMAIKENILYVDNAIDLIAINLLEDEKGNLAIVKRIENVFPEVAPPDGGVIPSKFNLTNRPPNTIIVSWTKK